MKKLPSYPLFLSDPFFSIWSSHDALNDGDTMFWNGQTKKTLGLIQANGKSYCFMGTCQTAEKLTQTDVVITAFETRYSFSHADFDLKVNFISPLPLNDLKLLSCPVCYLQYQIIPKTKLADVKILLAICEDYCYNYNKMPIRGSVLKFDDYECGLFGNRNQNILCHSGDSQAASWGYYYLTGQNCFLTTKTAIQNFAQGKTLEYLTGDDEKYLTATFEYDSLTTATTDKFMIAFDDICSVCYFGQMLKGYFFKDGETIIDALKYSYENYESIMSTLDAFDLDLTKRCLEYGEHYRNIAYASFRQSVAAHKLTVNTEGNLLFLSKECHSNGCIATVDVSYPSIPLYLLYNTEYVKGMLRPIFKFANMPVWDYDFAPHDAGTYPYCLGQTYGLKDNNDKYHAGGIHLDWSKEDTFPPFYLFPSGSDIYAFDRQMPVEECSNMIIMCTAITLIDNNINFIKPHFQLLKKWCNYLLEYGLIPDNQLCTDDFAGHLDKNTNLAVKAIMGIKCFSVLCEKMGDKTLAKQMSQKASEFTKYWLDNCIKDNHSILTYDSDQTSFSLKYNMIFDTLFKFDLFPASVKEAEVDEYIKRLNEFGTPLDSRRSYTKSDWILWCAALSDDKTKIEKLLKPIDDYLKKSPTRVPFSDWYDTVTGKQEGFQNRTVQGGMFMLLLKDYFKTV